MSELTFTQRVAAAERRLAAAADERSAAADDKARAIAAEAVRCGGGKRGAEQVAEKLGVHSNIVYRAVARARRAPDPGRTLPGDLLERLLAAEQQTLPPLPALQWQALAHLVRGTIIDVSWIEQPGLLLADEVEAVAQAGELGEEFGPDRLAQVCRSWSRVQALAVIDACQRDGLDTLPTLGMARWASGKRDDYPSATSRRMSPERRAALEQDDS